MKKMDKEKIKIILLGMITVILFCLLVVISLSLKNSNELKNSSNLGNSEVEASNKVNSSNKDSNSNSNTNSSTNSSGIIEKEEIDTSIKDSSNQISSSVNKEDDGGNLVKTSEEDVVNYFENLDNKLDTYKKTGNNSFTADIKSGFITVVDFLFYDGYIKGYTFKEVSDEVKIKVLTLALKIDNKIDSYLPNYKETIKDKTSNLKEKIAITYLEVTNNICDKLEEASCNIARENFKNMKDSFGFTWEGIKSVAKTSSSKLKEILSEWYQSIK